MSNMDLVSDLGRWEKTTRRKRKTKHGELICGAGIANENEWRTGIEYLIKNSVGLTRNIG
jgi:hypothetical protein